MTLEKVTKSNIGLAIRVQEELFPDESGRANLEESLESGSYFAYYLILDEGNCTGIIGLYSYPEDPEAHGSGGSASGKTSAESILGQKHWNGLRRRLKPKDIDSPVCTPTLWTTKRQSLSINQTAIFASLTGTFRTLPA